MSTDAFSLYSSDDTERAKRLPFADGNTHELLTAEQEVQLMHQIWQGGSEGKAARDRFIAANQGLVIRLAQRYVGRGLDLEDLVQEGNIGLIRALQTFDCRGKFSTYATWWVFQSITRAIAEKGTTLHIPVHVQEAIQRLRKREQRLLRQLGREPTGDEIAEALELTLDQVEDLQLSRTRMQTLSLEMPLTQDDELTLSDLVAIAPDPSPEEAAISSTFGEEVRAKLATVLDPREYYVLAEHFGFGESGEGKRLAEIARDLGRSRERVRQIAERAMNKLRAVPDLKLYSSSEDE
jgi:RNA polymerase primary sigma factor